MGTHDRRVLELQAHPAILPYLFRLLTGLPVQSDSANMLTTLNSPLATEKIRTMIM